MQKGDKVKIRHNVKLPKRDKSLRAKVGIVIDEREDGIVIVNWDEELRAIYASHLKKVKE